MLKNMDLKNTKLANTLNQIKEVVKENYFGEDNKMANSMAALERVSRKAANLPAFLKKICLLLIGVCLGIIFEAGLHLGTFLCLVMLVVLYFKPLTKWEKKTAAEIKKGEEVLK